MGANHRRGAHACGIRYRVIGSEHIPREPCIILSKHQSAWETLVYQVIFPPQVWVLKRELLWVPFFGWGLAMLSPIAIDRRAGTRALKQMFDQGRERLRQGFSIVMFPEGTRTMPGKRGKYHPGGAWLAVQTGTQVAGRTMRGNSGGATLPEASRLITVSTRADLSAKSERRAAHCAGRELDRIRNAKDQRPWPS